MTEFIHQCRMGSNEMVDDLDAGFESRIARSRGASPVWNRQVSWQVLVHDYRTLQGSWARADLKMLFGNRLFLCNIARKMLSKGRGNLTRLQVKVCPFRPASDCQITFDAGWTGVGSSLVS